MADRANNRVMVWDSFPTSNGAAADVVLGQPTFAGTTPTLSQTGLDNPSGLHVSGTQLFVVDRENNRVLIFEGN